MATEPSNMSLNGGFVSAQPHNYAVPDQSATSHSATNSLSAAPEYPAAPNMQATSSNGAGNADIPKDEVGWYFVEQYYTTMSRSPEKLHVSIDGLVDLALQQSSWHSKLISHSSFTTSGLNSYLEPRQRR